MKEKHLKLLLILKEIRKEQRLQMIKERLKIKQQQLWNRKRVQL